MRNRRWIGFALPLLIAASIWGMPGSEKRHQAEDSFITDENISENNAGESPMLLRTSLADTLAPEFVEALGISDVSGTKIVAPSRTWASYFTYRADERKVFAALKEIPFSFTDKKVDLAVRPISLDDLHDIKNALLVEEISNTSTFWTPNKDSRIYEFIKPPFRHTLIVSKTDGTIQHRVEFAG